MAGIGDAWGDEEELLHPRGPDGRWISAGGIAKNIIGKVLDFLRNFRPRQFQSQGQSAQYLQNVAGRQGVRRMGRPDHIRLLHDLGPANADLRDGVIDEPSTQKFVQMMDRTSTELPDDVILTRVVGVDAFGFTPETAKGVDADNPGIRGMSGKLVADRGYGLTTVGNLEGTAPQGTVRMVIAAKKGTKVTIPAATPGDSTVLLHRDQPLRVTKVAPDGAGGWTMYVTADSAAGEHDVPEPIGGPIGVREPSKAREARIKSVTQAGDKARGVPDEQADLADEETRRRKAAEGQQVLAQERAQRDEAARQQPVTPAPTQTSGPPPRQPAPGEPPPRTEPVVGRVGEAPAAGQPAAGVPEPTPPSGSAGLKQAVRDSKVPSPSRGPNRAAFNAVYLGVSSGKMDPADGIRELDADIAALRRGGEARDRFPGGVTPMRTEDIHRESDIDALQQLRDVIAHEYGLEEPAPVPAKKAARKAAKKAAPGGMTPEQEQAVVDRGKQFRGAERNEEEQRIVRQADEILARRRGEATPEGKATKVLRAPAAKKAAPKAPTPAVKKAAPAEKAAPEAPGDPLDGMTKAELLAEAKRRNITTPKPSWTKDKIKAAIRQLEEPAAPEAPAPVKKAAKVGARKVDLDSVERRLGTDIQTDDNAIKLLSNPFITMADLRKIAEDFNVDVPKSRVTETGSRKPWTKETLARHIAENVMGHRRRTEPGFNAPEAPAPAKKATKAAVPEAAPRAPVLGDRFKIPREVQVGDTIVTRRRTYGPDGKLGPEQVSETRVASIKRGPGRSTYQFLDADGNIIRGTAANAKIEVIRGPEAPAPVKKAAKAARPTPPNPDTVRQQLVSMPADQRFPFIEDQLQDLNLTQSRALAKSLGVRSAGRQEKPEIIQAIVTHFEGAGDTEAIRRLEGGPDLFERLRRGEGPQGHPGDSGMARMMEPGPDQDHQVKLDRVSAYGDLGTMVDELHANEAGPEATASRLRSKAKQQNIPEEDIAPLVQAAEAGDRQKVLDGARALMRREGIEQIGNSGDTVPLDPKTQTNLTRGRLPEGTTHVVVVRPGSRSTVDGEDILIERATVLPATPDEARAAERATRLVPEASVPGTRADTPVDNAPRRRELRKAMLEADLPPASPGSGRKSQEEIKGDLTAGRITPEEAVRRFESEIAFTDEDLTEVDAHIREGKASGDLSDVELARLERHRAQLQATRESHAKHAEFLRGYTKDEAPVHGLAEAKVQDPVSYEFLKDATPDDMREAAKEAGLDPPNGDTTDEMFTDLLKQVARRELERRAAKKATKAVKKAAKKAAPEAPPTVPRERERVDAKLLAEGIDGLDDKTVVDLQRFLDGEAVPGAGKNPSPAKIADWLNFRARGLRDSTGIIHGNWDSGLGHERTPEEEAERLRQYNLGMGQAQALEELAGRVRGVRRRSTKAPAAKKAAPEVQAAEAKADNLEARIIDDRLERVNAARSRDQGDAALEGLTLPELRRIGDSMGIKGRGKQDLRDKILDRFFPEPSAPEAPAAPTKSLSRRAADAGISIPGRSFSGVDSGVSEADRRLKRGDSHTEVARFLRERAGQVAKADLNEEGRRFPTEQDPATLREIRKQSAEYLRRVATHVQQEGRGRTPAKKAAPAAPRAPGAPSASRTGTSSVTGDKSTKPELPNSWGGRTTEVHFHSDGIIGMGIKGMGEDRLMDVDGEPLSNVLGKLATRAVMGDISQEQLLDELKRLAGRLPEGSAARRSVDRMVEGLDAPKRDPLDLPDGTPGALTTLMRQLSEIPLARGGNPRRQGRGGFNEMDTLQELVAQARERYPDGDLAEARRARWLENEIRSKLLNHRHESEEGKFQIDRAVREAMKELEALVERSKKVPAPSAPVKKAARLTAIPGGGTGTRSKGARPKLTVVRNEEGKFSFTLAYEEESAHV